MALVVDRGPEAVEMAMRGETSRRRRMRWEPPGEEEGDMYARSSGLIKANFFYLAKVLGIYVSV